MAGPSTEQLRTSIKEILEDADLSNLSSKKVRRMLEENFESDLGERKKEIDGLVMELVEVVQKEKDMLATKNKEKHTPKSERRKSSDHVSSEEDDELTDDEPPPKKVKAQIKRESKTETDEHLSDEEPPPKNVKTQKNTESDENLSDEEPPPRNVKTQKTQRTQRKQKNTESDESLNDEELAKKLQEEEQNGLRSTRHRSAKKPPKQRRESKPRKKQENKGNSPYSRPCALSPELATVMGTDRMARNEVVKRIWQIVKERKLEDPKNKQFMLCDEELFRVFGKKRVRTFGMMKVLKNHIKDLKDITISCDS